MDKGFRYQLGDQYLFLKASSIYHGSDYIVKSNERRSTRMGEGEGVPQQSADCYCLLIEN